MRPPVRDKSPSSLADAFRTCWNAKEGEEGVGGRKAGGKSLAVRRVCVCTRVWPKNGREMERIGRIKDCVKTRFAKVDPHAGCRKLEYGGQLRA